VTRLSRRSVVSGVSAGQHSFEGHKQIGAEAKQVASPGGMNFDYDLDLLRFASIVFLC
jgi:hypothetical protein